MNWRLALSELEAERRSPAARRRARDPVLAPVSARPRRYANLLQELYCLDAVMTVSLEWRPWAMEAARRRIRGAQRHYFARRYSMMAHVQETEGTAAAMVDSAAATESDRLGEALVELEADGVSYGEATLTVALHGELGRIERAGRRPASSLRRARREGDPGGLRPAAGLVLAAPGPASRAAGAEGVRVGRCGGVSGTVVRAATGHREEQASRSRVARGLGDPVAYGLPLRPVRRRRGPHADARRYRLGQELHTELPPGRSPQVRPARPDPGSGRLVPLADPVSREAATSSCRQARRSRRFGCSRSRSRRARGRSSS